MKFNHQCRGFSQIVLAVTVGLKDMHNDLAWFIELIQRVIFVPLLDSWLLASLFKQIFRYLLSNKPIRQRGQVVIFDQKIFYLLQLGIRFVYLLMQFLIFCQKTRLLRSISPLPAPLPLARYLATANIPQAVVTNVLSTYLIKFPKEI